MFELPQFPDELGRSENTSLLTGIVRGIEREALRIAQDGSFSKRPHPESLGSALTHPQITTDFSEALLEFITPPTHCVDELFNHLQHIHSFVLSQLDDELLWTSSMPCILPQEDEIEVARYGNSNNGQMKTIYRVGLGHRYGRAMQTVAGIHYNFSLPLAFWAHFHTKENSIQSLDEYRNSRYLGVIRNFRRHYWLLILLFGASPAMCSSFVGQRKHNLDVFPGGKALYQPYATSLRMGDLGYQSTAQESLYVCYNAVQSYISTLSKAILEPHAEYAQQGIKDSDGNYRQLSDGLLQIENEFYSSIRPKRSAKPGETALTALSKRGIEYIEVRCLDINPFTPLGISREQVAFLDTFLLYCTLQDSPDSGLEEFHSILSNQKRIVNRGREPGLRLEHPEHGSLGASEWATELLKAMQPVAALLDGANDTEDYTRALTRQQQCIDDLNLTPSAQLLDRLKNSANSYPELSLELSKDNSKALANHPIPEKVAARFEKMSTSSLREQKHLEDRSGPEFDEFLRNYYKQYQNLT